MRKKGYTPSFVISQYPVFLDPERFKIPIALSCCIFLLMVLWSFPKWLARYSVETLGFCFIISNI